MCFKESEFSAIFMKLSRIYDGFDADERIFFSLEIRQVESAKGCLTLPIQRLCSAHLTCQSENELVSLSVLQTRDETRREGTGP